MNTHGFSATRTPRHALRMPLLASAFISMLGLFWAQASAARDFRSGGSIAHRDEQPSRKPARLLSRKVVMDAPGVISTLPVEITAPGNYTLSTDLSLESYPSATAISIKASGVAVDCGWHSIQAPAYSTGRAILIADNLADVSVSNCVLDGFYSGIRGNTGGQSLLLLGNEIRNSQQYGIYVGGDSSRILMNRIVDLRLTEADPGYSAFGIFVASYDSLESRPARGVVVQGNQVAGIASDSGDVVGIVLRGAEGTQVLDNKILDLRPASGRVGYGIWLTTSPREAVAPVPTTATVIDGNAVLVRTRPGGLAAYKVDSGSSDATACTDNLTVGLVMPAFAGCLSSLRNVGSGSLYPLRVNDSQPRVRGSTSASRQPDPANASSVPSTGDSVTGKRPPRTQPLPANRPAPHRAK